MAAAIRKPARSLRTRLREAPHEFSFFQVVRLLRRLAGARTRLSPNHPDYRPAVWFRSDSSMAFPPSEVLGVDEEEKAGSRALSQGAQHRVKVAFMGLTGHDGPLPDHYTRFLNERIARKDYAFQNFLAMFEHRLLEHFYQAWEKSRYYIAHEQGREDPMSQVLFALMGLGSTLQRRAVGVPAEALLQFGGLLLRRPVPLEAARYILEQYFAGTRIELEPFIGRWVELEEGSTCRLGKPGPGNELGRFSMLGARVWDVQSQIRLRLTDLTRTQVDAFSPDGKGARELAGLMRLLTGGEMDIVVELYPLRERISGSALGESAPSPTRLGIAAWLRASSDLDLGEETAQEKSSWTISGAL